MTGQREPAKAIESAPPASGIVRSRVDEGTVVHGRVVVRDSRASGAELYGGAVLLGSAVGRRVGVASSTISASVLTAAPGRRLTVVGSDLHHCMVRPHNAAPPRPGMIVYVDAAESFIASTAAVLGERENRCSIMASRVGGIVLPGADLRGAAVPPGAIAAGVVRGVALPAGAVLDGRAEILDPLHVAVVDVAGVPGGVTVFRTATGAPVCSRPEWEQHPRAAAAASVMLAGSLPDPLTAGPAPHDLPGMAVPAGRAR